MFDLGAALIGIVLLSPIFLLAAAVIKLGSSGPVLFTQERLGQNGTPFRIFKFRTMVQGAERLGSGSVSLRHDPRLFWGAATLRRFKIDELPQLFNVLSGTMSMVGPRPTIREDYRRMNEAQRQRSRAKPGLTGLAQINGNTTMRWPERIEFDLAYLDLQPYDSARLIPRSELLNHYWNFRAEIGSNVPGEEERKLRQLHADVVTALWLTAAASRVTLHPFAEGTPPHRHWSSHYGTIFDRLKALAQEIRG